jgi:hypothetical protein
MSDKNKLPQVSTLIFDLTTRTWRQPRLQGDVVLLHRTAHAACLHPTRPEAILLFGGYTVGEDQNGEWLGDLVVVDTRTLEVRALSPAGPAPLPRGYHAMATCGVLCISLYGRSQSSTLVSGEESIVVYNAAANKWHERRSLKVSGAAPVQRGSLRVSSVPGGLLAFGGAGGGVSSGKQVASGDEDLRRKKQQQQRRLSDLHLLRVEPAIGGFLKLTWKECCDAGNGKIIRGSPRASSWPAGRAAHGQAYIGGKLFLFGGYRGNGASKINSLYAGDVWSAQINQLISEETDVTAKAVPSEKVLRPPELALAAATAPATGDWQHKRTRRSVEEGGAGAAECKRPRRLLDGSTPQEPVARTSLPLGNRPTSVDRTPAVDVAARAAAVTTLENAVRTVVRQANTTNVTNLELQLAETKRQLDEQRQRNASLTQEQTRLGKHVERLTKELATADDNWRAAAREAKEMQSMMEQHAGKAEEDKLAMHQTLERERQMHAEQLSRLRAEAFQWQNEVANVKVENSTLKRTMADLECGLDKEKEELKKERHLREALDETYTALRGKFAEAEEAKRTALQQVAEAQAALAELKENSASERSRLKQIAESGQATIELLHQGKEFAEKEAAALRESISKMECESQQLKARVQRGEEALTRAQQLSAEVEMLRKDLVTARMNQDHERSRVEFAVKTLNECLEMQRSNRIPKRDGHYCEGAGPSRRS